MALKETLSNIAEIIYILCGLVSVATAIRGLKNEKAKIGTFLFWFILGITFIFGKIIPYKVTGGLLIILALFTVTKQLQMGSFENVTAQFKLAQSERLKNKIFIPAILIGTAAFLILQFKIGKTAIPPAIGIGGGSLVALLVAMLIIKPKFSETLTIRQNYLCKLEQLLFYHNFLPHLVLSSQKQELEMLFLKLYHQ